MKLYRTLPAVLALITALLAFGCSGSNNTGNMVDAGAPTRIKLFAGLDLSERSDLAKQVHERHYNRGSVIFSKGDPVEAAYFVHEGRVKIYRLSPDGTEQLMGLFGPGQPFGLVTALDSSPYPASAQAIEDSLI